MKISVYSPTIRRKEMDAVLSALVEDKIGPGEQAKFLIQTAREKIKFDYCLALRSPAIALQLAIKSIGEEKGKGVLISAFSPFYYATVIEDLGLVPVYCDIAPSTACISRETVEKALASRPEGLDIRCIVVHHTLGYLPETEAIVELGYPVIEDCSQSYGSSAASEVSEGSAITANAVTAGSAAFAGSAASTGSVASYGSITILGLEERDMLTSGGGALLYSMTRRDSAALRAYGDLPPEYGLPDMNAAMAVVQFREAAKNLLKRREIARLYAQSAMRTRHKGFVQPGDIEYNNYAFPLILETGVKEVKAYARKKDIAVENAFDNTLAVTLKSEQCPEAYSLSLRTVLFPIYPRLSLADAGKVAKLILTLP